MSRRWSCLLVYHHDRPTYHTIPIRAHHQCHPLGCGNSSTTWQKAPYPHSPHLRFNAATCRYHLDYHHIRLLPIHYQPQRRTVENYTPNNPPTPHYNTVHMSVPPQDISPSIYHNHMPRVALIRDQIPGGRRRRWTAIL